MKLYTVKREKSFLSPLSYLFFSKKTCLFKPLFQSFLYNSEHLKIQADSYPMPTVHSCSIYGYFPPAAALAATACLLFHTRFQPPQIRLPETILPLPCSTSASIVCAPDSIALSISSRTIKSPYFFRRNSGNTATSWIR